MISFEERLESFEDWPEEYKSSFVAKLAVMGQYNTGEEKNSTCCVFCKKEFSGWKLEDEPLFSHIIESPKCILYKLYYSSFRKTLSHSDDSNENLDKYFANKFIKLSITRDKSIMVCLVCGRSDLNHKCSASVQKISNTIDLENAQFYIKYFSGRFNSSLAYINQNKELNQEQIDLITYMIKLNPNYDPFDTLGSFLDSTSAVLFKEIESKMKKMENEALLAINEDSIILN